MYFNAKDELITIVPNFSLPTENCTATCISVRARAAPPARRRPCPQRGLLPFRPRGCLQLCASNRPAAAPVPLPQGEFGPFQPNREVQVPLWLAHTLWKRKRCSIKPPAWMDAEHLDAVLGLERQDASAFQRLPFHYIEARRGGRRGGRGAVAGRPRARAGWRG